MDAQIASESSAFGNLSLPSPLLKSISKMGFTQPTPIQEQAIPLILAGRDTISLAETGSGKTAAYLLPVLAQLLLNSKKRVLILAPTRELATQIGDVVREITLFSPDLRSAVLIGGSPMFRQIKSLQRNPQVVVATPGRLMDHVQQRKVDLQSFTHIVLDEADRMFDMGFSKQVAEIVRRLPNSRQTLLFSATFPSEVRSLAERVLSNPVEIEVRKNLLPPKVIDQKMIPVDASSKNDRTLELINAATGSVIIFARTKHRTDRLARFLEEYGVPVTRIHGDRTQGQRNKSISGFKSGLYRVMVATDIAARGLDMSDISDVINYDLPMNSEDYVHRIGRTGRAGQSGQALTLVAPEDLREWAYIARKMGLEVPETSNRQVHSGRGGAKPNRFTKKSFRSSRPAQPGSRGRRPEGADADRRSSHKH